MTITFGMNIDNARKYTKTQKAEQFSTGNYVRQSMRKVGNPKIGGPSAKEVFTKLPKDFIDWEKGGNLIDLAVNDIPNKKIVLLKEISKLDFFTKKLNRHKSLSPEIISLEFKLTPNLKLLKAHGDLPKDYPTEIKNLTREQFNEINNFLLKNFNLEELRTAFKTAVEKHLPAVEKATEYIKPVKLAKTLK